MIPRKKEKPKEQTQAEAVEQPRQEAEELHRQVEELRRQAEGLQKEKDEIFAKLQRVAADYDNYQKRASRQITDSIAYEKEVIIRALLPVLDNFEHALANAEGAENAEQVVRGVRIVYEHILGVMRAQGVEQIKAAGEKFDPVLHEAITQRTEADKEDGIVLEELQRGYKLNGRVIRPSRVAVNKLGAEGQGPEEAAKEQPTEEPETKDTE